ncbi:Glycosyl transferase group 1 OS=Tsukamurella paurometabola (strain ATCC 8368 / DSM / CCUG 35730/ CIP 100753 / JCM 10117 / KCTC 9821 / NBRC 16120 / NCIMB 702349 / NCTC 13040) OX=521096 GN=Tpau_1580 PE=4 SV=1 [Tsukamurella paurometabola]|uniref:Glycosyl transferase group 1 n=1 Tax=Tsukamurella paurometabola (strain ATCC 8368 / DSM 20162 / CCUG 35730 / CIP 100753 / JCM 10117 / KCTC 9821 / NBRC 16120 / NCIMB 702349 / NCTC 13040) TaxID=521096 RepID=D5UY94_TSUPD|nr:glycosyltransferase family 4 protein [Tsukamurella paurometabola]ADG78201.1 glycosyl transferase group 1 [Tsukamurella paurometabola DSM 20162]SUP30646.1 Spore coat protein SA [Tsukamurella paurometabola]
MTKVALLSHSAAPSGAELAWARMARRFPQHGIEPLAVLTEAGPLQQILADAGVEATVVDTGFASSSVSIAGSRLRWISGAARMVRAGWRIGGVLRAAGAEAVLAESTKALLMGTVAARRAGIPLIWHVHDRISPDYFGPVALILRALGRVVARGFIANSRTTRDTLWTGSRPAAVVYPGVDLTSVPGGAPQRAPEEARVLMLGRLAPWKGQDLVLEALARTRTENAVRFVGGTLFGEHEYADQLRRRTAELGLGERVEFVGNVSEPLTEAAAADVVVHFSRLAEPFGQVVVEAMAAHCAVIAAASGGPTEIIDDGVDGVLVPTGDPVLLAAAIDRLIDDRDLRTRLADRAAARAEDFGIDTSAEQAAHLIHRTLDGRRPR